MLASSLGISSLIPYNIVILTLALTLWSINYGILTSLLLPHLSSSLTDSLPSLNHFCHLKNWCSIHARCYKSSLKHSKLFCAIFPCLKQHFIAYHSSKVSSRPDGIFEIHQLWQSGFSRVYSNRVCTRLNLKS